MTTKKPIGPMTIEDAVPASGKRGRAAWQPAPWAAEVFAAMAAGTEWKRVVLPLDHEDFADVTADTIVRAIRAAHPEALVRLQTAGGVRYDAKVHTGNPYLYILGQPEA